ncbi:hypothetical protein Vafri_19251 [Volvox africanus]|uniref:Uncharacterized protein n=1 Tax=Volvox africanus TaxID=51714 RepID=A0A8J4BU54_9CHLO|nr:hypothetical protein Vafri_19251 [Volvox africanus]
MSVLTDRILREAAQEDDLSQVVALELRNRGLTELGPIDRCQKLKVLDLAFNQLKNVKGLEGLDKLKELRLSDNRLTSTSALQRLSDLHTLALDGNLLNQLEGLLGLRSLKLLNVSFNQLSSLSSLGRLTSLEVLHVAGNQLTDLEGLTSCPALRIINACSNRLQHLKGLARCAALQELHVADNKLTDLSGLKSVASTLEILDVSGNGLTSLLGLCSLPKLSELYTRENALEGLDGLAARLPALELLDIASNRLAMSAVQLAQALAPLTDLAALQLMGNARLCSGAAANDTAASSSTAGPTVTASGTSSGSGNYVMELFAALPSLELCDRQERAQVLVVSEEPVGVAAATGDGTAGISAAAAQTEEEAGPPPNLDPTIAEMEAFRKRLGIRTYAPQYAGRPATAARPGTAGSRPGTSAGLRPGTAGGGRPGSKGRPPMSPATRLAGGVVMDPDAFAAALGDFRTTMASYSTSLKSVLTKMRANLKLPAYEAAQRLKAEGATQLPQMPLAPEYGARPRNTNLALLGAEDREEVEKREEALQMFERLFGGSNGDAAVGEAAGSTSASGSPKTSGPKVVHGAAAVATTAANGRGAGQRPGSDDDEYDEYDVELRSSYTAGTPAPSGGAGGGGAAAASSSRPGTGASLVGGGRGGGSGSGGGNPLRVAMPVKPPAAVASTPGGFVSHKPALLTKKAVAPGAFGSSSPGSPVNSPSSAVPAAVTGAATGKTLGAEKLALGSPRLVASPRREGGSPGASVATTAAVAATATAGATGVGGCSSSRLGRPTSAGRSAPRKLASNLVPRTGGKMLAGGGS